MASNIGAEDGGPRQMFRLALAAVAVSATGAVIWAFFRYVVSDERLLLDYVRVLIWPTVVGFTLYWLRAPLREKFGQLFRVEGFGASAEFSPEAQARRLTDDLAPELGSLFPREMSTDVEQGANQQRTDTQKAVAPEDLRSGQNVENPDRKQGTSDCDARSGDPEFSGGPWDEAVEQEVDQLLNIELSLQDLLDLGRSIGLPGTILDMIARDIRGDRSKTSSVLQFMKGKAQENRTQRNIAVHNTEQNRDSIETVIRKSAAWGYDMGKAGAPRAVPDVEWSSDGTWKITTEVPAFQDDPSTKAKVASADADRMRQIKALEDEIRKLEREKHSLFRGPSIDSMTNDPWLGELKRRLRVIDSGNPWGVD